jgi:Fe-Mn family superoxide dismutase
MMKGNIINKVVAQAIAEAKQKNEPSKRLNEAYSVATKTFDIKTESLSEDSKKAHQELLAGYVEALNRVSAELDTADRDGSNPNNSQFRNLKIDESHNLNAAFLHGLFFENVGDVNSKITMDTLSFMRLERDFGTFDAWQKDFIACALAARNGWAVTCYNTFLKRYINVVVDLHCLNVPFGCIPVIVVDCWEHTYYRDYLKDRKSYVFAMMKELRWSRIDERFDKVDKMTKVMG